jgi:hypothetical protein
MTHAPLLGSLLRFSRCTYLVLYSSYRGQARLPRTAPPDGRGNFALLDCLSIPAPRIIIPFDFAATHTYPFVLDTRRF